MKRAACAVLALMLTAGSAAAADDAKLTTDNQRFSYALGLDFGTYLKKLGYNFDMATVEQAIKDGYTPDAKLLMTQQEAEQAQKDLFQAMLAERKEAAKKFLEENKTKEGVKTTESGLQYKIIKEGKGDKPTVRDTVKVQYKGTLLDGTEFDSSYSRNEPARFQVKQVIPGWIEGLQLMTPGSVFELYVPPELGYGDQGAPPVIPPGSLLKFKVELLEVIKSEEE
ncbi:Peptidyl-prolyl cis-trans isomerase [Candidatus Electronema halotolerans]|jgi:FKBP-type peptidyl-prolyl cis-trans isomerase